ncbi:MAG: 30S ribosomal protein S13, partial [Kiritimatiellae bacterium]|nr:30S ribosomal protein S13 [Kiritimatiellia bacterium]
MPRIFGVEIPGRKRTEYALCSIYGIGLTLAREICEKSGIDPAKKADALNDEELSQISKLLQTEYRTEGDLRREISGNIRRLISINSYRGSRHRRGLPVRGQRT